MKDQRKTEIKVGIMVILGLVIFLWILGWAKNFNLRDTDRTLLVKFSNVAGLEVGDYVTVNGVRKGNVEDFSVENNSVMVRLSLDRDVILKKDAVFAISMLDLMGGKRVEIVPGSESQELNYDLVQQGIFYADIPSVMSMLGTVQQDLFSALKEVNTTLISINKYLSDEQFNKELRQSIANITEITSKLNKIIDENRTELKELVDNSVILTRNANEMIDTNKDEIKNSVSSLQSVLTQTDSLVKTLNKLSAETIDKKNNLGKILYDDELFKELKTTLSEARQLIKILTEQLKNDGLKVDADVDIF